MQPDLRRASKLVLPPGNWPCLLDFVCARFPHIQPQQWQHRFERGLVVDGAGGELAAADPYQAGLHLYYFREVANEPVVPFQEQILFEDELLLVVDKPHFLTVSPVGQYVEQTLLRRLQRRYPEAQLSPLHRLDRLTAGVIMFCKQPARRDAYQQLFRAQQLHKTYEAIAVPLPHLQFPLVKTSCLEPHPEHFFLTAETNGAVNSETHIEVLARGSQYWHYLLKPITGRKHQLRVHMHSLGAPIVWDDFYPQVQQRNGFTQPLQLLARSLEFVDPVAGLPRHFVSRLELQLANSLDAVLD